MKEMDTVLWIFFLFAYYTHIAICSGCPKGTIPDLERNLCIKLLEKEFSYMDGLLECGRLGGNLLSIPNESTNKLVATNYKSRENLHDAFFGADCLTFGGYEWRDGTQWYYTNWKPNIVLSFSCAVFNFKTGFWDVESCFHKKKVLCEMPVVSLCPKWWAYHDGNCYGLYRTNDTHSITVDDAQMECQEFGAHLVSIHSERENEFITDLVRFDGHCDADTASWIGLRSDPSGEFSWTDGTPTDYMNSTGWWDSQPSIYAIYNCKENYTGWWDLWKVGDKIPSYICKMKAFS